MHIYMRYTGIADNSAGELTRDAALANLMSTRFANGHTPPNPNTTFPVYANTHWNPSVFAVQKGQVYRIEVPAGQVREPLSIAFFP